MKATIGNAVIEGTVEEIKALLGLSEREQREEAVKPTVEQNLTVELIKHPGRYKRWTAEDDNVLVKLSGEGIDYYTIAKRLNRSYSGVTNRAMTLRNLRRFNNLVKYSNVE